LRHIEYAALPQVSTLLYRELAEIALLFDMQPGHIVE
jgi:hypothetical protein